jgi:hypothetical protein
MLGSGELRGPNSDRQLHERDSSLFAAFWFDLPEGYDDRHMHWY